MLSKIFKKVLNIKYARSYSESKAIEAEKEKLRSMGFDVERAEALLKDITLSHNFTDFIAEKGMSNSVHWLLFCCIACSDSQIRNILEIGTYDGVTAKFLSHAFPDAKIDTLDLPPTDPILSQTYSRESVEAQKKFLNLQQKNTSGDNINLILKNSFFLPEVIGNTRYDLVWVDGGHKYPDVAWDICNGYHVAKPEAWLMFDDVVTRMDAYETSNVNANSLELLTYIEQRVPAKIHYLLKRTSSNYSSNPFKRKHVAIMRKPEL